MDRTKPETLLPSSVVLVLTVRTVWMTAFAYPSCPYAKDCQ